VSDLLALLRRILDDRDLAACGVLADYLEERGDARGVLLRRRWKRWGRKRDKSELFGSMRLDFEMSTDNSLWWYIRDRFPEWNAEQVRQFGESLACAARRH
jgi:hypothetical protein